MDRPVIQLRSRSTLTSDWAFLGGRVSQPAAGYPLSVRNVGSCWKPPRAYHCIGHLLALADLVEQGLEVPSSGHFGGSIPKPQASAWRVRVSKQRNPLHPSGTLRNRKLPQTTPELGQRLWGSQLSLTAEQTQRMQMVAQPWVAKHAPSGTPTPNKMWENPICPAISSLGPEKTTQNGYQLGKKTSNWEPLGSLGLGWFRAEMVEKARISRQAKYVAKCLN